MITSEKREETPQPFDLRSRPIRHFQLDNVFFLLPYLHHIHTRNLSRRIPLAMMLCRVFHCSFSLVVQHIHLVQSSDRIFFSVLTLLQARSSSFSSLSQVTSLCALIPAILCLLL